MESNKISKRDYKILILLFSIIPIIDFINGTAIFLLELEDFSIGKIYRVITMILLIIITYKYSNKEEKRNHLIISIIIAIVILFYMLIFYFYNLSIRGLINDAVSISKLLLVFLIVYSMSFLYKKKLIKKNVIEKIFYYFSIVFPITMIIPYLLGIGYATYSNGFGYTGLYYANNDLSIVLLITVIFAFDSLLKNKKIKDIILFVLNLISLLLVGSKAGILGLSIALFMYFFYYGKEIFKNISIKRNIFILILLIGIILTLFIVFYPLFKEMLNRFIYFYKKEGNIYTALLSNRDRFLNSAINNLFMENGIIFKILFGVGFYYRKAWGAGELIEMDLFDIFFSLGLISTILITSFIVRLIYLNIRKINKVNFKYLVCVIIEFLFSVIAGHVMFSAFAGSVFGLLLFGSYVSTIIDNNLYVVPNRIEGYYVSFISYINKVFFINR